VEIRQENHSYTSENIALIIETNLKLSDENLRLQIKQAEHEILFKENLQLKSNLEKAEKKIDLLIEQIKLSKLRHFGKKTETGAQLQLELVFDEVEESQDEVVAELDEEPTETIAYTRKKKTVGRKIDTSKLPREQITYDLTEEEKNCKCGGRLEKFGEDKSEQLEYIPAQIKVIEHTCAKYSCNCCETVKTASKPEMPITKSMAAPSLITEVIIKKYEHHIPWYRQSKIFAQDGIDIPANTICNWFLQAGEVLEPLNIALKEQLNDIGVLQADETPVQVLHKKSKGYMWCYHSCEPKNKFILFEYSNSRESQTVMNNLKNYQGILQTDGYSGYNMIGKKDGIVRLGCWAHCRRKFAEVVKISSSTGKAHEVIKWIGKLYQIESIAREQCFDFAARKKLRQEQAPPILQKIHELVTQSTPSSKSAIGKAMFYTINQWEELSKYVDYGEAEIDNNWVENQIRPFAIGKKNWMFIGNERAAKTAAFFYSILQTCRMNNIDARKYLSHVLLHTDKMRRGEIDPKKLLPQFIDKSFLI
jgi:transposase